MKTKLVLWGENHNNDKLLLAIELLPEDEKVKIYCFDENMATQEFYNTLMHDWRRGKEIEMPEGHTIVTRPLNVAEEILPANIRVMRTDVINRTQTEWHFVVLSHKMSAAFRSELEDLEDSFERLTEYKQSAWEELKGFWDKVQKQIQDKNLFWDHYHELRGKTDMLFNKLKELRQKREDEFRTKSKSLKHEIGQRLEVIEEKIKEGRAFKILFDELKKEQKILNNADLTRGDRNQIWKKLDHLFKTIKQKQFGDKESGGNKSNKSRLENRYDGLLKAIDRMKRSLDKDNKDLFYENKRMENSDNQLENQLRKAKLKMIEQRIHSKTEKLDDMLKTKKMLEDKIEKEKVREAKKAEETALKKAKEEEKKKLKAQIKKEIQETHNVDIEEEAKLKQAASLITNTQSKAKTSYSSQQNETGNQSFIALQELVASASAAASILAEDEE